ncbi:MAG: class I tRNA ligase family protein [Armatimonadota bacterium]|nr:class I tRNA ligase family protein [Armatimonadota bacterium]MDR7503835.1 class I tRNA ligase family protein [Armatimonadota bacterium]MDR7546533.1 class I tRNA ligase family protein [Armatimonadota bacterium]MDR7552052.1 class I tRNA ligase family protein [Armatimonadota bacterium]MDR7558146.1 class I tRNA ligase family protein [Armatimonadota bacterium]
MLDFFPYPSGEGLSVGHARNYVPTDVLARYFRMRGYAVLHPMGWDAFGLPAENEALLRGRHPRETTARYAANYRRQLTRLGCSYDWTRELITSDPAFYRWTQWGFLLLYRRGLAYRATGWQWWCPACRTILANEQVVQGRCWRHGDTPVERRALEQWYVRTTAYAERLLRDLDRLDWPEHIKTMQRNWIGRSEGAEIRFGIRGEPGAITVFTTRPQTLSGAAFIALAPEHPQATALSAADRREEVARFVSEALRRTEIERQAGASVRGVFTGAYAAHPLTGRPLPVYVADYVLAQYGEGAVMGVPAADARDAAFARRHALPVLPVDGTATAEAVLADLARAGAGGPAVRYRMRDWLISRQRYWGAPITIVYCAHCGTVPVPDDQLPVRLPEVAHYVAAGTGRSPLDAIPEFVRTVCPRCGGPAERETDTLDGFADSNWYFLRFADPRWPHGPWNPDAVAYWLPVDWYVGGAEHAVMHLLYARFFTKVLYDAGMLAFDEPFVRLRSQGSVLSPVDGARMSKSRGNVVTPDEVAAVYGADALRLAVMFIGPFDQDVTWDPEAAVGAARFLRRLHRLVGRAARAEPRSEDPPQAQAAVRRLRRAGRKLGELIEAFRCNVLVAELMTVLNDLEALEGACRGSPAWRQTMVDLTRLIAPVAPFLAEEAWAMLGQTGSVHRTSWPEGGTAPGDEREATIVIQVDDRVRDRLTVAQVHDRNALVEHAGRRPRVRAALRGREIADVIVVPGRVVNFVTRGDSGA